MENLILLAHLLTALAIIGLILLQQGKGAEMGASFGSGASQTLFGATGSGNFFAKLTAIFAAVFFATSMTLAIFARQASIEEGLDVPVLEEVDLPTVSAPDAEESDLPVVSEEAAAEEGDLPVIEESPVAEEE
jgi:preprotein translocase subunit SecG